MSQPVEHMTPPAAPSKGASAVDFLVLTKPRITLLVVLTTLVGYWTGRTGPTDVALLANTLIGTALVAAAASALNQFAERRLDAAMRRTARRPLPAGRLEPHVAFAFGVVLWAIGAAWLRLTVNALAAFLAIATAASYLLAYTPLKRVTSLATVVGAVPGAIPPMIGWAAARNSLDAGAWVLFLIVFLPFTSRFAQRLYTPTYQGLVAEAPQPTSAGPGFGVREV